MCACGGGAGRAPQCLVCKHVANMCWKGKWSDLHQAFLSWLLLLDSKELKRVIAKNN